MTLNFAQSIQIKAPVEKVFYFFEDLEKLNMVDHVLKPYGIKYVYDHPKLQKGKKFEVQDQRPGKVQINAECVEFVPNERILFTWDTPYFWREHGFHFHPTEEGTKVDYINAITLISKNPIYNILLFCLLKFSGNKKMKEWLQNVRDLIEQ